MFSWISCDFVLEIVKCYKAITKTNMQFYIVTILQVSSAKKFIKNINPYVVKIPFTSPLMFFLVSIWDFNWNYIHTFIWKSLLKRHFSSSYELQISLTQHMCALICNEYVWPNFWGDWFSKQHSALWSFYSLTYDKVRVKC